MRGSDERNGSLFSYFDIAAPPAYSPKMLRADRPVAQPLGTGRRPRGTRHRTHFGGLVTRASLGNTASNSTQEETSAREPGKQAASHP